MQKLFEFVVNHWDLFLALAIILAMMFGGGLSRRLKGYKEVETLDAVQLINHQDALLVDVREDSEYREGHVSGSLHIPLGSLDRRADELAKHRDKPIIVGCRSGHRSARGCAILRKHGFENVYNLKGGMMAWQNAGMPLSKPGKSKKRKAA